MSNDAQPPEPEPEGQYNTVQCRECGRADGPLCSSCRFTESMDAFGEPR